MKPLPALTAVLMLVLANGSLGADISKGKKVYNKCKACHTLVEGKHRIGPSLAGIFGRQAGTTPKYRFSKAMKKAGAEGLVWTESTMDEYLARPRAFIRGAKMTFVGLKRKRDRENLIAFLKRATEPRK